MVITHIKGGLGNQLFQYAYGKFLAMQLNEVLYLDNTLFTSGQSWNRAFNLDKFGFKFEVASAELINRFDSNQKPNNFRMLLQRLQMLPSFNVITEDKSKIDLSLKHKKGNLYLKGYWQMNYTLRKYANIC